MNTPMHCGDDTINALIEMEAKPYKPAPITAVVPQFSTEQKRNEYNDHPLAAWIFKTYKRDTAVIAKKDAWRIGNELNRMQSRIDELEQIIGLPLSNNADEE